MHALVSGRFFTRFIYSFFFIRLAKMQTEVSDRKKLSPDYQEISDINHVS